MEDPAATIEASILRARRLFASGQGTTLEILKEADKRLSEKLHAIVAKNGGPTGTFTEASAVLYRKQIQVVTAYLESRMLGHTHTQALASVKVGLKDTVTTAKILEKKFSGITRPLALEQQGMQDALTRGVGSSLLAQHKTSVGRYGKAMIADFERTMRVGALEGISQHSMISRLVETGKLGGVSAKKLHAGEPAYFPNPTSYVKRSYWAERIVRTEKAYAYNSASLAAIQRTKVVDFPDMQKKILATFDMRTAMDSKFVHGQIRNVDENFVDGAGRSYLHPPARPNDRETVIPWRPAWTELPPTTSLPPDMQAEASVEATPGADDLSAKQRKAELKAALDAAKGRLDAQKQAQKQAVSVEEAKAAAVRAQAKGTAMATSALELDKDAIVAAQLKAQHLTKLKPSTYEEAKAKAMAYQLEKEAKAKAKAEEEAAKKQAEFLKDILIDVQSLQDKQVVEDWKSFNHQLKMSAKQEPLYFAALYKHVTGKTFKVTSSASVTHAITSMGKKLVPDMVPKAGKKTKVVAPPPAPPAPPKPVVVSHLADLPEVPKGITFKEVPGGPGGMLWVDMLEDGNKLGLFYKDGLGNYHVKPPPGIDLPNEVYPTPEAAAPYALKVSKTIAANKSAVELAKHAAEAEKKKLAAAEAEKLAKEEQAAIARANAAYRPPTRKEATMKGSVVSEVAKNLKPNRSGWSTVADGNQIENQEIHWAHETVDGVEYVVARMKLVGQAGDQGLAKLQAQSAKKANVGYPRLADISKNDATKTTGTVEYASGIPGIVSTKLERGGVTMVMHRAADPSTLSALHNEVEVRIPIEKGVGGTVKSAAEKVMAQLKTIGVDGEARPTEDQQRALRRMRIMSYASQETRKAALGLLRGGKLESSSVDAKFEEAAKGNALLAAMDKDSKLIRTSEGKLSLYSDALAESFKNAGVTHLQHSITGDVKVMEQMFVHDRDGGLLSSAERFRRGLAFRGMSTTTDFETGGADSVFLRLRTSKPETSSGWMIEVDTSELGRMDAYFFNADRYGRAAPTEKRQTVDEMLDLARDRSFSSGNEIMLQRHVPVARIRRVRTTNASARADLLRSMKEAGILEVNGVPLEEFISK